MSEAPENNSPIDNPLSSKGNIYHVFSNGEEVNIFDLVERNRRNMETEMGFGLLKAGDIITFQSSDESGPSNFLFDVKDAKWDTLGISGSHCPAPQLIGTLRGPNLPDEVNDQEVVFTGSGFGGSIRQVDTLATGQAPYFWIPGRGEYRGPIVDFFQLFRRDQEGNLQPIEPNQLDAEKKGKTVKHQERLAKAEQLMKMFGFTQFDIREGRKLLDQDYLEYEDNRYLAQYSAEMAMGNSLVIFDKQTGQWMELKYYNFKNDDFLQIAFADLSGHKLEDVFILANYILSESSIHASREAITTYASSGRYGIEGVNYKPSDKDAAEVLGIPPWGNRNYVLFSPDIQVWPDGRIETPVNSSNFRAEDEHPGLLERVKNSISATKSDDDTVLLNLNGKNVQLKNPDIEIDKIAQHLGSQTNEQNTAFLDKNKHSRILNQVGKIIGRFIPRKK